MDFLTLMFVFLFGGIIGSFLNVVILRMGTGQGITGRSMCFSCSAPLAWFDLIPILSFLGLRGRCRRCKSAISMQYILVEACTGFLFVLSYVNVFRQFPESIGLLLPVVWAIISILVVVFVYDIKHTVIPLWTSISFALLSVLYVWITADKDMRLLAHAFYGFLALPLFLGFLWFVSKGKWMGFGDVEFAFGMGIFLGISQGLSALACAFWIGALYSVARMYMSRVSVGTTHLRLTWKPITMKSEVPFAPFLVIGTMLSWLFSLDIFHITYFL